MGLSQSMGVPLNTIKRTSKASIKAIIGPTIGKKTKIAVPMKDKIASIKAIIPPNTTRIFAIVSLTIFNQILSFFLDRRILIHRCFLKLIFQKYY